MKKMIMLSLWMLGWAFPVFAQVAVNTDNSDPDGSAMLDVKSITKGVLVPRMTAAQRDAIASPANGLMIFCTDNNQYYFNQGTPAAKNWVMVNSQWLANGSSIYYNAGNVGIGTSAPTAILDVNNVGVVKFRGGAYLQLDAISAGDKFGYLSSGGITAGTGLKFETPSSGSINGLVRMTITNEGKVGIGTTSPDAKLTIGTPGATYTDYGITSDSRICVVNGSGNRGAMILMSGGNYGILSAYNYGTNTTMPISILPDGGNVGIGTTAPHAPLQFSNMLANRKVVLFDNANNDHQYYGFGVTGNILRYQVDATSSAHTFYAGSGSTTSNELMRIQGDGNVGIGFISPYYKLDIGNGPLGTYAGNTVPWLRLFGTSNNLDQLRIYHSRYAVGGDWGTAETRIQKTVDNVDMHYISFKGGYNPKTIGLLVFGFQNTEHMVIESDGNIGIGTSNPEEAAALDISSTTRGFLPPRMTTGLRNAIASPVAGLVIYNTDENALNVYNGTAWMSMIPIPAFACGLSVTINHLVSGGVAPVNKTVSYGTVNGIPGEPSKCWITQNLGATRQANSVDDANEPAAGWYWQFNRKQGYKHDGTTLTPAWTITTINESSNWVAANDPCSIEFGSSWRIPMYYEWNNVVNTGGWTDWNGPWNSGLKLHAAGYLLDGSIASRGSYGSYWSSTQITSTEGKAMRFETSYVEMYNAWKPFGRSVRCVRDN